MPSPTDQAAVERAALALAEGDPTADWLKAQDAQGSERTWMLVKIVMRAVALFVSIAVLVLTSMAGNVLSFPLVSNMPLPAGPGDGGKRTVLT